MPAPILSHARARLGRSLSGVLAIVGLVMVAQALWLPAKAWLAQHLIARAYAQGLHSGKPARPWPWADTWPAARLSAPRLGVVRYVLADASPRSLAFGPGLMASTGRIGSGLVVAGHRDTHLAFMAALETGDELLWEDADGSRRYRIVAQQVADVRTDGLVSPASDELLLSTCWPLRDWRPGGPLRLVMQARRVGE